MASFTKFEDTAASFLQAYPIGAKVRGEEILDWATQHANGLAADLAIDRDDKKLLAVRRHINSGAASRNFVEAERFYIDVEDAKRKTFAVIRLADHVQSKATAAFGKSVSAALSPIKSSIASIDDLKLDQLSDQDRKTLEERMTELIDILTPLKKVFHEKTIERWVLRLVARGYTKEQAHNLIELLPTLRRELKLIDQTT